MMRIKDLEQSFIGAFGAMAGIMLFMIFISLYAIIIAGSGYYILKKYNKKNEKGEETPLLKELTNYQYIGIILILFGPMKKCQNWLKTSGVLVSLLIGTLQACWA